MWITPPENENTISFGLHSLSESRGERAETTQVVNKMSASHSR